VFASHYDSGRVTRHLDETVEWAELARRAIADYPSVEEASGIAFHHPSGLVYATDDPASAARLHETARWLAGHGVTIGTGRGGLDDRVSIAAGSEVFTEGPPAGHVDPRRMVAAQQECARRDGAEVLRTEVTSIERVSGGWSLATAQGTVTAGRVVVAAGPHSGELLPQAHPWLDVRAETVVMAELDDDEQRRLTGLPAILAPVDDERFLDVYLVPPTRYPDGVVRVKLGATRHDPIRVPDAASRRTWMRGDRHLEDLAPLRRFTEALLPGLRAATWATKPCLLTDTVSGLPIVDHVDDGLVLVAGCNGYAGKSGDAIGALAASLVVEGRWTDPVLDAARFRAPG
jgi:sarcosine oxidase